MTEVLKLHRETQQLLLSLVLEHDRASTEENGGLDLGALFEESSGMLELELEVVLISVRPEADLLDHYLRGVGLHLLGLLLALIEVLLIIENLTYRRIGLCAYLHQVEFELISNLKRLRNRIDARLRNIVSNETYLMRSDLLVYVEFVLVALLSLTRIRTASAGFEARRLRFVR